MSTPVLCVGILGATDSVRSTYVPILRTLQAHYHLTVIFDADQESAKQCQAQFDIPHSTTVANDVFCREDVDLVLNVLPTEYHEKYTVAALEAGKHVMVEVPLSMSIQGLRRIRDATKKGQAAHTDGNGPKVFVGCARRYAPCFNDVFKKELASMDRVYYARCRNIAGQMNAPTTSTTDQTNGTNGEVDAAQFHALLEEVFGSPDDLTPDRVAFCRYLGTMGCHDLSLMRETLGFPDAVSSVSITDPFYSAIFHYTDSAGDGHPFTLLYEAGVDAIPRCDAHLTVYGARKTISVQYDFPSPGESAWTEKSVRVVVEEADAASDETTTNGHGLNGHTAVTGRVKRTETVSSCEEAYTQELMKLHSYLTDDASAAKTTPEDALMDLRLLRMIFEHYDRQCGTIRTPLG